LTSATIKIMMFLIFVVLFFPLTIQGAAVPLDTCYTCHDMFKNTQHGNTTCTDCHRDITDLPHGEKVKKPECVQCHRTVPPMYNKSVHAQKNMKCAECHDAHSPSKEKKNCTQCHTDVRHLTLPSAKKHVNELTCEACHGKVQSSLINVNLNIKNGGPLTKNAADIDNNGTIDGKEWEKFLGLLGKDAYRVSTKYFVKSDVHSIMRKATSCNSCHADGPLFKKAYLKVSGVASFDTSINQKIFIPDLPSIEHFKKTLHGIKGVQCSDCHASQVKVNDKLCINCHRTTYNVYKNTAHASSGATVCTDCHNPHSIKTYKELNAGERLSVCTRCHKDYLVKHKWLPNTTLHFNYLECSTCHSPESEKSIAFSFNYREGDSKKTLTYGDMKNLFPDASGISSLVDTNGNLSVASQELSDFFVELKKRLNKDLFVGSSLLVTKVHHDYSSVSSKEKVCSTCHSEEAPFYQSMYLVVPEEGEYVYLPVKGTTLSALPTHLFVDLSLLGEEKIKNSDIQKLFSLSGEERMALIKELGWKWIDFFGITFIGISFIGIILHIIGRIIWRR